MSPRARPRPTWAVQNPPLTADLNSVSYPLTGTNAFVAGPSFSFPAGARGLRIFIRYTTTGGGFMKVFEQSATRQYNFTSTAGEEVADVFEYNLNADATNITIQFYSGGSQTLTIHELHVWQVPAVDRYIKGNLDATFAGNGKLYLEIPCGAGRRVQQTFQRDGSLDGAFQSAGTFLETQYVNFFQMGGPGGVSGSQANVHVNNNDLIIRAYRADNVTTDFIGNTHGGETSLTSSDTDITIEYDTLGDGTWRTWGQACRTYRQAKRFRLTHVTKLLDGLGVERFRTTKIYTVFADGIIRQDRTVTVMTDTRIHTFYFWMASFNLDAAILKAGVWNRVLGVADGTGGANVDFGSSQAEWGIRYAPAISPVVYGLAINRKQVLALLQASDVSVSVAKRNDLGIQKIYNFLTVSPDVLPAGWEAETTQWAFMYVPADTTKPEAEMKQLGAIPDRLEVAYPAA